MRNISVTFSADVDAGIRIQIPPDHALHSLPYTFSKSVLVRSRERSEWGELSVMCSSDDIAPTPFHVDLNQVSRDGGSANIHFEKAGVVVYFDSDIDNAELVLRSEGGQESFSLPYKFSKSLIVSGQDSVATVDWGMIDAECIANQMESEVMTLNLNGIANHGGFTSVVFRKATAVARFSSEVEGVSLEFLPHGPKVQLPHTHTQSIILVPQSEPAWKDLEFRALKDGYSSRTYSLQLLDAAMPTEVEFVEVSVAELVTTQPPGAEVWIRGVKVGNTPYRGELKHLVLRNEHLTHVEPASVRVARIGFEPAETVWSVTNIHGRQVHFDLVALPSGYVKFESNQSGVDLLVDGVLHGQITKGRPLNIKLPIGEHSFTARKEFFKPITISTVLREKDVFTYQFNLIKASEWVEDTPEVYNVRQASGSLKIVTSRSDLEVEIQGATKTPPFELSDVPAGSYDILVKGPNLRKTISIIVNENEEVFIDLDILK